MKETLKKLDKPLLIMTIILAIFGLIMIFSASSISAVLQYKRTEDFFFSRQLFFIIAGFLFSLVIIFIPTKWYSRISNIGIIGIIALLFALRTYGITTNSAQSWLPIFSFSLQPSEFAKTIIIIYLACWYGNKTTFNAKLDLLWPLIPCIVIFGLVASEPDFGTAGIIAIITMLVFFSLPIKNKLFNIFKVLTIITVIGAIVVLNNNPELLTNTQAARFNFKNPCERYLEETGYQVCNGYIAINNGGLLGVGLGKSTQKYLYLPEAHTDFIFPIVVEELGIVGGAVLFIMYIILLYRVLAISQKAKDLRGSMLAFGTFALIITHIGVNLGGILAIIPLTGVPLPFMSYGGSFMINLLVLLAITQRVAIESKEKKGSKSK